MSRKQKQNKHKKQIIMDKNVEKLELLGWLIVKGKSQDEVKSLLGKNQRFCKLSLQAVKSLPKDEFAQGKKNPYINMIMDYTNHKKDGKFKHQKEDLVIQDFDVEKCIVLLLINGFFSKWILSYFRGFAKIIEEIRKEYQIVLSEENTEILLSYLEMPVLSEEVKRLFSCTPEELAQKITEGNGARSKIVSVLKEDGWIHLGKYKDHFGIKKGDYLISNSDFEFLFEVNQMILKKVFQKKIVLSDLSKELILLCSRLSKNQQLDMVETLEDASNARLDVGCDSGKTKIRLLGNTTDYIEVLSQIKTKFPSMQVTIK